eukprot:XP_025008450.1 uncharacterized protein LOC112532834 [Gallus gallus]
MCPDGVQLQLDQHLPHLVPAPAGLELPIIAGCGCLLSLPVGMALFFAFWVPERLLRVMECFSSCLPCCPLAPRWSFSDQNADGSALTKCDAKGRARLQNRLLDWTLHHQVPLSFLTSPGCGVGRALILGKGWQWSVVTLLRAARALLRLLVDTAGTRTHRWMPRSAPSSVWQVLLTPEVVPMLAEVQWACCWLSLVLTLLSPGVLPLPIIGSPFWWDLRAFC